MRRSTYIASHVLTLLRSYLETGGEDATIKPWVWILWLGGGPLIQAVVFQYYIFLSVRMQPVFWNIR